MRDFFLLLITLLISLLGMNFIDCSFFRYIGVKINCKTKNKIQMETINKNNYREVLETIAEQYDLEVVNTTDKSNGYPSNIMPMLIGFKNFEQFETISNEYPILNHFALDRKDGWQLWYRKSDWFTDCFEVELDNNEYEYKCSYYYDTHTYAMALGIDRLSDLDD